MTLLEKIREEVTAGRVTEQTHPAYPHLSIFKYSDTCNFEDGWNETNRICRGLIVDTQSGEIVARSFPKFFNIGERAESSLENLPNEDFDIFEKMDGSMGSLYHYDGAWRVATPGSMMSPQSAEGQQMLSYYKLESIPLDCTPVVEIIYPENRIVVDYGDRRGLVLLAVFNRDGTEWSRKEVLELSVKTGIPAVMMYPTMDIKSLPFTENQEGYVIRFASGLRVKAKSPVYVMAHRFLSNISIPRVVEGCRDGSIAAVAAQCPPTWRATLDDMMAMVRNRFDLIKAKAEAFHALMVANHTQPTDRKTFALWIQANVPKDFQAAVFQLLSNKDITEWVWKRTEEELVMESKNVEVNTAR
jgi:hypothetical protein